MADEPNTQNPAGMGAQNGDPSSTPATPDGGAADDLSKLSPEELRTRYEREVAERKKANAEAQAHRKKLNSYEEAEKKRQQDQLDEVGKRDARIKELEEAQVVADRKALDARILVAASKLGFADPDDAVALVDRDAIGEDGANIEVALKDLLKRKAHLAAQVKGNPPPGGNPSSSARGPETPERQKDLGSKFPFLGRLTKKE